MVFMELGIEELHPAHVDVPKKWRQATLLQWENVCQAIREQYSTPRLRDPMQLLRLLRLPIRGTLQNGTVPFL